jgi:hypothetical protein
VRQRISSYTIAVKRAIASVNQLIDIFNSFNPECWERFGLDERLSEVVFDSGIADRLLVLLAGGGLTTSALELIRALDYRDRCGEEKRIIKEQLRSIMAVRCAEVEYCLQKLNQFLPDTYTEERPISAIPDLLSQYTRKAVQNLLQALNAICRPKIDELTGDASSLWPQYDPDQILPAQEIESAIPTSVPSVEFADVEEATREVIQQLEVADNPDQEEIMAGGEEDSDVETAPKENESDFEDDEVLLSLPVHVLVLIDWIIGQLMRE